MLREHEPEDCLNAKDNLGRLGLQRLISWPSSVTGVGCGSRHRNRMADRETLFAHHDLSYKQAEDFLALCDVQSIGSGLKSCAELVERARQPASPANLFPAQAPVPWIRQEQLRGSRVGLASNESMAGTEFQVKSSRLSNSLSVNGIASATCIRTSTACS